MPGLGKSIHGVIVFVGSFYSGMGSDVVIGRSIYGVAVIDVSLYSNSTRYDNFVQ